MVKPGKRGKDGVQLLITSEYPSPHRDLARGVRRQESCVDSIESTHEKFGAESGLGRPGAKSCTWCGMPRRDTSEQRARGRAKCGVNARGRSTSSAIGRKAAGSRNPSIRWNRATSLGRQTWCGGLGSLGRYGTAHYRHRVYGIGRRHAQLSSPSDPPPAPRTTRHRSHRE
jgi:hypothetical protein